MSRPIVDTVNVAVFGSAGVRGIISNSEHQSHRTRKRHPSGSARCLKALQPGNTLVLWKLDRLGRDLRHLVNTVEDLRVRGVGLRVIAGAGAQIDTTTANDRLALGIFAAFAEFERELIAERTQAGLAAARAGDAWADVPARLTARR